MSKEFKKIKKKKFKSNFKKKKESLPKAPILMIIGVFLFFTLAGSALYKSEKNKIEIDKSTFCPIEKEYINHQYTILIDATDRLPKFYSQKIKEITKDIEHSMQKYDKLSIYILNDDEDNYLIEKFSMCNPGRGRDINPLIGSQKIAEHQWKKNFHQPLAKLLDELENLHEAKKTPLLDSLEQLISKFKISKIENQTLYLVSDLMEYTKSFSMYMHGVSTDGFDSSYFDNYDVDFDNIEIHIILVKRDKLKKFQTREFKKFWKNFFKQKKANTVMYQ